MDCSDSINALLRDLRKALKSDDVKKEVEKIIRRYSRRYSQRGKSHDKSADYYVRAGESYYIDESKPKIIYRVFEQVIRHNYRGMCITRSKPETLEIYRAHDDVDFRWLSTLPCANCVSPGDLSKLLAIIKEFLKGEGRGIIIVDGIDSLIVHNDFTRVIKFLQSAKDAVSASNGILIISLNMNVLGDKERAMINNELVRISKE